MYSMARMCPPVPSVKCLLTAVRSNTVSASGSEANTMDMIGALPPCEHLYHTLSNCLNPPTRSGPTCCAGRRWPTAPTARWQMVKLRDASHPEAHAAQIASSLIVLSNPRVGKLINTSLSSPRTLMKILSPPRRMFPIHPTDSE